MTPEILSIIEVAGILKTSVPAVRMMITRRKIPFRYIGGRNVRFLRSEIEAWILGAPGVSLEKIRVEQ